MGLQKSWTRLSNKKPHHRHPVATVCVVDSQIVTEKNYSLTLLKMKLSMLKKFKNYTKIEKNLFFSYPPLKMNAMVDLV